MGSTKAFRINVLVAMFRLGIDPNVPMKDWTGSFQRLLEEFRKCGHDTTYLKQMPIPKPEGLGTLALNEDQWRFTHYGIEKYERYLQEAIEKWRLQG